MADQDSFFSDDLFADTRMSFGEHLEELRVHLWKAVWGFLFCMAISLFFGRPVLQFIAHPVEQKLKEFYKERVDTIQKQLGEGDPDVVALNKPIETKMSWMEGDERVERVVRFEDPVTYEIKKVAIQQMIGRRPTLSTLSIQEACMAYFKVSMVCGFVLGSPWIFYQLWLFVASGLYPHEKHYVYVFLPVSLGLFLFGVAICQFCVIPAAIEALLWFNQWIGLEPDLRFSEWLSFAILMPLVFGISFQLPLVMMFLERIGVATVDWYWDKWRLSFFLIHVFAALITPSVDVISMELLALPMFGLYMLGIYLCRFSASRKPSVDMDVSDSVEV